MNFTWWVNRKDVAGRNVFQGGFLGLDNIGRVRPRQDAAAGRVPRAERRHVVDGRLRAQHARDRGRAGAKVERIYEDIASKFFEHFLIIADAMNSERDDEPGLWDPGDQFYYDQLYLPDGERIPMKVAQRRRHRADLRGRGARGRDARASAALQAARRMVSEQPAGARRERRAHRRRRHARAAAAGDLQPGPAARHPAPRARRERVPLAARRAHALALPSRPPVRAQARRRRVPRRLRAGGVDERALRRQLELARAGVVPAQLPPDRSAAALPLLPRRRVTRSSFRRVRAACSRCGTSAELSRRLVDLFRLDEQRPPAVHRRRTRCSRTIRTGATTCCSTSTSTATPARDSARRTRPAGPDWSQS